jgi:hypothetical protein
MSRNKKKRKFNTSLNKMMKSFDGLVCVSNEGGGGNKGGMSSEKQVGTVDKRSDYKKSNVQKRVSFLIVAEESPTRTTKDMFIKLTGPPRPKNRQLLSPGLPSKKERKAISSGCTSHTTKVTREAKLVHGVNVKNNTNKKDNIGAR